MGHSTAHPSWPSSAAPRRVSVRGKGKELHGGLASTWDFNYGVSMDSALDRPVGLIADSHGRIDLMELAVEALDRLGAQTIVHLGDICDSLAPLTLEKALPLIEGRGLLCVLGNNEYAVVAKTRELDGRNLPGAVVAFLESLPYTIAMGDVTFCHAAPYPWPASLRWPHPGILPGGSGPEPFRILFRGHSHTPSVVEIRDGACREIYDGSGAASLDRGSRYVVTVGALEQGLFALYDPKDQTVRFMRLCGP